MNKPLLNIIDRGNDPTGHGHFGAKRGSRKHKGHDIVSIPKENVTSMIDGVITKIGYAYNGEAASHLRYVEVSNNTYRVWLMYLTPSDIKKGDYVCAGERLGFAADVSSYHSKKSSIKMINHLHIQIWKHGTLVDPYPYLHN